MRILLSRSLALGAFLTLAGAAHAEPWTLEQAIRLALQNNPEFRAADESVKAADDRAKAARGAFLPQVGVRYFARRSDNPLDAFADKLNTRSVTAADLAPAAINEPGASSLQATQLTIEMPLYTGGRLVAGKREAGAHAEAAQHALDYHRQALIYRTLQAWREAQAAREAETIAADTVAAAREHAETTARLLRQGRIVASDKLTAELNLSATESAREQAAHRARLALDGLRRITGVGANAAITLPAWEDPALLTTTPNAGESEQRALSTRPDLQSQEAMLNAARARIHAARSAFHPQVGVVASDSWYDRNAALDNKSQSIMGVVSMNLFTGGRDWHQLNAAQHDSAATEQQLEGLRQNVRNEVRAAASALAEAQARRAIATRSVEQARENVRLIKGRYGEGRTLLIELLMAERLLVEARQESLNAALAQDLSAARLQLAEGRLTAPGPAPAP
jgi:outer membrane protein TolC